MLLDRPKSTSSITFDSSLSQCSWATPANLIGSVIAGRQASIKKPSMSAPDREGPREIRAQRIEYCLVASEGRSWPQDGG